AIPHVLSADGRMLTTSVGIAIRNGAPPAMAAQPPAQQAAARDPADQQPTRRQDADAAQKAAADAKAKQQADAKAKQQAEAKAKQQADAKAKPGAGEKTGKVPCYSDRLAQAALTGRDCGDGQSGGGQTPPRQQAASAPASLPGQVGGAQPQQPSQPSQQFA